MKEPLKKKVESYLQHLRYKKYGRPTISATEINQWCEARNKLPANIDEPFVLNYYVHAESVDPDEQDIKVVMSTLRLLGNLQKSMMVQCDGTFKVVWQGYPLVLVGTSDQDRKFHPYAVAVCKGEGTDDFSFIFESLRSHHLVWHPEVLLADGSDAITAGFRAVFVILEFA